MRWGRVILTAIAVLTARDAAARPDMDAGRFKFTSACASCHSLKRDEIIKGPSLAGVFGRRAGSVPGFNYSEAMKKSRVIWTEDTLDTYIASPFMMMGSGIDMMIHGIRDDRERADLIEFLKHAH